MRRSKYILYIFPSPFLFSHLPHLPSLPSLPRSASLRSVFHSLRAGHCPYFYLCANQFTALFLCAGVGGCPRVSALLSPTTSGLRQALSKEGEWGVWGSLKKSTI